MVEPGGGQADPVVIAGGGLVGLSTAMFLARHGVASLVIERLRGGSPLPARRALTEAPRAALVLA